MNEQAQYWIVGAYWDNQFDMTETFVAGNYWELGWDIKEKPEYGSRVQSMSAGDRIAIKAWGGQGKPYIIIKALGIIKSVDPRINVDEDLRRVRIYVEWKLSGLERRVPSKGKFESIHDVSDKDEGWVNSIFVL